MNDELTFDELTDGLANQIGDGYDANQAARLLEEALDGGSNPSTKDATDTHPMGDTVPSTDGSGEPNTTHVSDNQEDGLDASNAQILAKDGKHTIPFEKLQQARQEAAQAKAERELALAQLSELKASLQTADDPKATQESQAQESPSNDKLDFAKQAIAGGIPPNVFGDFGEEDLIKGIAQVVEMQVQARLEQALSPLAQKQEADNIASHFEAIYQAHPDADSLAESQELKDWVDSQPSYAKSAIEQVLQSGTASQVIEVLTQFKTHSANSGQSSTQKTDIQTQVKAMMDKANDTVPTSLTDIGGRTDAASDTERLSQLSSGDMLEKMQSMTPEQIERFLNSI